MKFRRNWISNYHASAQVFNINEISSSWCFLSVTLEEDNAWFPLAEIKDAETTRGLLKSPLTPRALPFEHSLLYGCVQEEKREMGFLLQEEEIQRKATPTQVRSTEYS